MVASLNGEADSCENDDEAYDKFDDPGYAYSSGSKHEMRCCAID